MREEIEKLLAKYESTAELYQGNKMYADEYDPALNQLQKVILDLKKILDTVTQRELTMYDIESIVQTCSACPSQWEGKLVTGKDIYIRYRHGQLSVAVDGESVFRRSLGSEYADGILSYDELKTLCGHIISFPSTDY